MPKRRNSVSLKVGVIERQCRLGNLFKGGEIRAQPNLGVLVRQQDQVEMVGCFSLEQTAGWDVPLASLIRGQATFPPHPMPLEMIDEVGIN
jgi:hypothetical protein